VFSKPEGADLDSKLDQMLVYVHGKKVVDLDYRSTYTLAINSSRQAGEASSFSARLHVETAAQMRRESGRQGLVLQAAV